MQCEQPPWWSGDTRAGLAPRAMCGRREYEGDLMLLPVHMRQTSVRVTYMYVQSRKHTLSSYWAYCWYSEPG